VDDDLLHVVLAAELQQLLAAQHIGVVAVQARGFVRKDAADMDHGINLVVAEDVLESALVHLDLVRGDAGLGLHLLAEVHRNHLPLRMQARHHPLGQRAAGTGHQDCLFVGHQ
jgi:hypothetical protein